MSIISLPQPSMALNAWNMSGMWYPRYQLHNSWTLSQNEAVEFIVEQVGNIANGLPNGKWRCLVINSHGSCGRAALSARAALDESTVDKFSPLKGKVGHILITACEVIGVKRGNNAGFWDDRGVKMISALSRATGANVYASNESQAMDASYFLLGGQGDIDGFEGDVLRMNSKGEGSWLSSNSEISLIIKSS